MDITYLLFMEGIIHERILQEDFFFLSTLVHVSDILHFSYENVYSL